MKIDRIFYLTPNNRKPCGGVLINYQHCDFLQKNGFEAYPLTDYKEPLTWFDHDVKHMTYEEVGNKLSPNDIIVVSEVFPYMGSRFSEPYKILFAQNWETIHHDYPQPRWYRIKKRRDKYNRAGLLPKDKNKSYLELGYNEVLSVSDFVADYVKETMNIKSSVIPNGIDLGKFSYTGESKIKNSILCLPRKNPEDIEKIKALVTKELGNDKVFWNIVGDIKQEELAKKYRESEIFLSTGYPEGFGLPHLEAMACGCLVVGFTGGGADMFMKDSINSLVAPDGDCKLAAEKLIRIINSSDSYKDSLRNNALNTVKVFSMDKMEKSIVDYFSSIHSR